MSAVAHLELDPAWIRNPSPMDTPTPIRAGRELLLRPSWIRNGSSAPSWHANPTLRCTFILALSQTDQYMDPWQDLALSLDPMTQDRHAYAGNNPIGYVDRDGHSLTCADGRHSACGGGGGNGGATGSTQQDVGHLSDSTAANPGSGDGQTGDYGGSGVIYASTTYSPPEPPAFYSSVLGQSASQAQLTAAHQITGGCKANLERCQGVMQVAGQSGCDSASTNFYLGSNRCNGAGKAETAWNVANAASWLVGVGEARATATGIGLGAKAGWHAIFGAPKGEAVARGVVTFGDNGASRGVGELAPTRISGVTYHGAQQVGMRNGGRGVSTAALNDAVTGLPVFQPSRGFGASWLFRGDDATVILNHQGQIVTGYGTSSAGLRSPGGW